MTANRFHLHFKIVAGLSCFAAAAASAAPGAAYAFTEPSTHASCAGSVSAGFATGAVPGSDRASFEHDIIQVNAANKDIPPGNIVSRHAKEHGDFASCL
jgi:hypothetical protein